MQLLVGEVTRLSHIEMHRLSQFSYRGLTTSKQEQHLHQCVLLWLCSRCLGISGS
ncbi:hypothetical protein LWH96_05245 [Legionella sp. 9fVS26]|nr:hypothetical protein [Legionella sp. 9fVS26]